MTTNILALDLEGTLISGVHNRRMLAPRPWLYEFLEFCRVRFPRIVLYTFVDEPTARAVLRQLCEEGAVPEWFCDIEVVDWDPDSQDTPTKNLLTIPGATIENTLIIDDMEDYIVPEQKPQWIPVQSFESKDRFTDSELYRLMEKWGN